MPALATHVRWLLALCAASVVVARVAWLASRLVRHELSERAQMAWLVGAWAVVAAFVVWGRPW